MRQPEFRPNSDLLSDIRNGKPLLPAPPRKFFNAEEAADYLGGMNSRTVVRWAREGYLPAYPIGEGKRRLWRFLESDLEVWMLSRRTGTLFQATDASTGEHS